MTDKDWQLYTLAKKAKFAMGGFWHYFQSGAGRYDDLRDKLLEMETCIKQALELLDVPPANKKD